MKTFFKSSDVQSLLRPCVYICWLKGVAQYVGKSKHGIRRPFDPKHRTISLQNFSYDKLEIRWQVNYKIAGEEETRLIIGLRPVFNFRIGNKKKKEWQGKTHSQNRSKQHVFSTKKSGYLLQKIVERFRHIHKRLHTRVGVVDKRCWFCNPSSLVPVVRVLKPRQYELTGRYKKSFQKEAL